MNQELHDQVYAYVKGQLAQANDRLKSYTLDGEGHPYPKRNTLVTLEQHIQQFTKKGREPRWVVIPGLRGVGKTTLLAQIYTKLECAPGHKLYISLDEAKKVLDLSLVDILSVYEEVLGEVFEKIEQSVYLFIDEVQYEENWGLVLKSLYDRTKKVFIFCTGSSAVSLQTNPDISRRVVFEKLFPLSFTEYMLLKERKQPVSGLGQEIQAALLSSSDAESVFKKLQKLKKSVTRYWLDIQKFEVDKYLKYGSLPFTLQFGQEPVIYTQIEQTLTNILHKDIPQLSKFDSTTLTKMHQILYGVSGSSVSSLNALSKNFSISLMTLADIFEVFEKSEVLLRVFPHGSHFGQVKKPSKYLFVSSAYRSMFFHLIGSISSYDNYKGQLLEDAVGLALYRTLGAHLGTSLTYDSVAGGADFIIGLDGRKIVVEVGYGQKDFTQVHSTLSRVPGSYGLAISPAELYLTEQKDAVAVPLQYFLLI